MWHKLLSAHEKPAPNGGKDQASVNDGGDDGDDDIGFHITQNDDEEGCPFCLCKPCITYQRNRQQTHYSY